MKRLIFILLAIVSLGTSTAIAQQQKIKNLPKYDKQRLHFGFLLGVNRTDFSVNRIGPFTRLDTLYVVEVNPVMGFNLGIVSNLRIGNHFDFRFIPTLSFSQRDLNYLFYKNNVVDQEVVKQIESTFLQFPVEVKFKSSRANNYRMYVTAGYTYAFDMVSQAKVESEDKDFVRLDRRDYGYTIGLGFDIYMALFKLSPEIKMFHGLPNLLISDDRIFSSSLRTLRSKMFMVSLTFE